VPQASIPVSARFRLIEGTSGWGVWTLHVALAWNEPAGTGPRLAVAVAVLSPQAAAADSSARAVPERVLLALEPAATRAELMRAAGRATALVALERLHRLSGDLEADTRLVLGPARRIPPPGAAPAAPRRRR
jgi:hypothetical protein